MSPGSVELAIIGGGAAGLFAAAAALQRGVGCVLAERKARVGSKMLMTANGRCNFAKDLPPGRMLEDLGEPVAGFARAAVEACPPRAVAAALRDCGLRIRRMEDGRLFPASGKAADVVHVFGDLLREGRVPLLTNAPVVALSREGNAFRVQFRDFCLWAENVLVATGGMSFPKTGSVGDGQAFARALGLKVEPCRAGLAGFDAAGRGVARLAGRRYEEGARASVEAEGREWCRFAGEVEIGPRGVVSGAAVYNCSRWVARHRPGRFVLRIDTPDGTFALENPAMQPLKEAIVTVGGVSLDEVDPLTMQAKRVPGLYFAGEVLDIDGPTGGYNLSLAFATGALAVSSVARSTARRRGPAGRGGGGAGQNSALGYDDGQRRG